MRTARLKMGTYIFLLVAISVICVSSENVFRKCCRNGEIVKKDWNGTVYKCVKNMDNLLIPLIIHEINYTVGFPEDNSLENCADKTDSGDIVYINNEKRVIGKKPLVDEFYKCCPLNSVYNIDKKTCEAHSNDDLPYGNGVFNLKVGMPDCDELYPNNVAIVDYFVRDNMKFGERLGAIKDIYSNATVTFPEGQNYCVDKTSVNGVKVIRVCKNGKVVCKSRDCLRKCCQIGEAFVMTSESAECKNIWNVPLEFDNILTDIRNISLRNYAVLPGMCDGEINFLVSNYRLYRNGSLRNNKDLYKPDSNTYCVEQVYDLDEYYTSMFFCVKITTEEQNLSLHHHICLIISCFFLGLTLLIYICLPELRNLNGKIVIFHVTCFLAAFILLALVKSPRTYYDTFTCTLIGYLILYSFLAAFSWLNVMCIDIWWTFGVMKLSARRASKEFKKLAIYCAYAFGFPMLMTALALAADLREVLPQEFAPHIGESSCWFPVDEYPMADLLYFLVPVAVQLFVNNVLFVLTAYHCTKIKREIQNFNEAKCRKKRFFMADKETFSMNLKLGAVMGITWIAEIITRYVSEPQLLWDIISTINMLRGVWVFLIFILKKSVWKALRRKLSHRDSQTRHTTVHLMTVEHSPAPARNVRGQH